MAPRAKAGNKKGASKGGSKTAAKAAKKAAKKPTKKPAKKAAKKATKKPAKAAKKAGKDAKKAKKSAKSKTAKTSKTAKSAGTKAAAKKLSKKRAALSKKKRIKGDPLLFAPLSEGERADALRILTADRRLASMTAVGRYRIIAVEPLVVKPPHALAKRRLARVVAYDYAADRSVHAAVDLDTVEVAHLQAGPIQPMLAREEEAAAVSIALASDEVQSQLGLGDEPQAAMHYWGVRDSDISSRRRSAAVLFGQPAARPSIVAVVDLLDSLVVEVVPASQW